MPPTFQLFVNDPKLCPDNYKVYLEKYLTKAFEFTGMPVRLVFKERERRELVFPKIDKRKGKGKKNQRIRQTDFSRKFRREQSFISHRSRSRSRRKRIAPFRAVYTRNAKRTIVFFSKAASARRERRRRAGVALSPRV